MRQLAFCWLLLGGLGVPGTWASKGSDSTQGLGLCKQLLFSLLLKAEMELIVLWPGGWARQILECLGNARTTQP